MNSKHRDIAFFFLAAALTVVISVILKAVSDISQTGVVAGFAGAAALFALGLVALAWPTRTPGAGNGQGRAEVSVTPVTRERGHFKFGDDQAKSAYLEVRNTGNLALADIEVRVVDVLTVEEKQDNPCEHITFNLHEWTPSLVYWSKKEADPPVLRMGIVKDGRRLALVAYSDQPQSQAWAFNTPGVQQVFVSEAKVTIQVSNKSDMLLERDYHIECHPQYPDRTGQRFDFEPWDVWERERPVKKLSGLREWGARIQSRMYHPPPRGGRRFPNEEEIDQFNDDIDHWVKITETCLGGPGALDLITFRNQVGLDSPYDENSDDLLTRQLLTNKNFVARRLLTSWLPCEVRGGGRRWNRRGSGSQRYVRGLVLAFVECALRIHPRYVLLGRVRGQQHLTLIRCHRLGDHSGVNAQFQSSLDVGLCLVVTT